MYTPVNHSFTISKLALRGSKFILAYFRDNIVVRMRQTVQISFKSALSQRDYNRGGSLQYDAYQRSWEIIRVDGNISIKYNKIKKNEIVFLEGVKVDFIASLK